MVVIHVGVDTIGVRKMAEAAFLAGAMNSPVESNSL